MPQIRINHYETKWSKQTTHNNDIVDLDISDIYAHVDLKTAKISYHDEMYDTWIPVHNKKDIIHFDKREKKIQMNFKTAKERWSFKNKGKDFLHGTVDIIKAPLEGTYEAFQETFQGHPIQGMNRFVSSVGDALEIGYETVTDLTKSNQEMVVRHMEKIKEHYYRAFEVIVRVNDREKEFIQNQIEKRWKKKDGKYEKDYFLNQIKPTVDEIWGKNSHKRNMNRDKNTYKMEENSTIKNNIEYTNNNNKKIMNSETNENNFEKKNIHKTSNES